MLPEVNDTRAQLRVELEAGLDEGDRLLGPKEMQPSFEDVQEETPREQGQTTATGKIVRAPIHTNRC